MSINKGIYSLVQLVKKLLMLFHFISTEFQFKTLKINLTMFIAAKARKLCKDVDALVLLAQFMAAEAQMDFTCKSQSKSAFHLLLYVQSLIQYQEVTDAFFRLLLKRSVRPQQMNRVIRKMIRYNQRLGMKKAARIKVKFNFKPSAL